MSECPNCGAPAPRPGGSVHRSAAAVAMGLAVAVTPVVGSACGDDTGGDDTGQGGAYGQCETCGDGGDDNNVGGVYGMPGGFDPGVGGAGGTSEGGSGGTPPVGGAGGSGGVGGVGGADPND